MGSSSPGFSQQQGGQYWAHMKSARGTPCRWCSTNSNKLKKAAHFPEAGQWPDVGGS